MEARRKTWGERIEIFSGDRTHFVLIVLVATTTFPAVSMTTILLVPASSRDPKSAPQNLGSCDVELSDILQRTSSTSWSDWTWVYAQKTRVFFSLDVRDPHFGHFGSDQCLDSRSARRKRRTSDMFWKLGSPKRLRRPKPNLNVSTTRCASMPASGVGKRPSSIRKMQASTRPEPGGGAECTTYPFFKFTLNESSIITLKIIPVHFFLWPRFLVRRSTRYTTTRVFDYTDIRDRIFTNARPLSSRHTGRRDVERQTITVETDGSEYRSDLTFEKCTVERNRQSYSVGEMSTAGRDTVVQENDDFTFSRLANNSINSRPGEYFYA